MPLLHKVAHAAQMRATDLAAAQGLGLMALAGWVHHPREWWHYKLPDPTRFAPISAHDGAAMLLHEEAV